MTADIWRSDRQHLEWAQKTPIFKEILAVLINGRTAVSEIPAGAVPATENRMLGRTEGYEKAIEILDSLARGIGPRKSEIEETYEDPNPQPQEATD